jgi:nicotinamidase-related amidase
MKTGLILVDIQNDYFPGGRMELIGTNEASAKAQEVLSLFRANQLPIFHVQHIAAGKGATFFLPNTGGVEIHKSVTPLPNEWVIQKHHPNSFRETRLLEKLSDAGVKRVVICGAMSHMCIDATARAASDFGFECVVIHDACATKNLKFGNRTIPAEDVHGAFMSALGSAYAKVLSAREFVSLIQGGIIK